MTLAPKKKGAALEMKTFEGKQGTCLVIKSGAHFHVFRETEAKEAAIDCGSKLDPKKHTRNHWAQLWKTR